MLQSSRRLSLLQIACLGGAIATTTTLVISVGCRVRAELQDGPNTVRLSSKPCKLTFVPGAFGNNATQRILTHIPCD